MTTTATLTLPHVGFRCISSELHTLTPEIVQSYRNMDASAVEREINQGHVNHLYGKALDNKLVTFWWVTAKMKDTGKLIRINGQHSSAMLAKLDGNMPPNLRVLEEVYECDDDKAVAMLFQQFDDRKASRTPADISGVYQCLQPALVGVDRKIAKLAIEGYVWYQRVIEKSDVAAGDAIYQEFGKTGLHPFLVWMGEIQTSKTRELQKKTVTAAMFGTFDANETEARTFWEEVSRGGDPDEADLPTTQLDGWLRRVHEGKLDPGEVVKPPQLYQGCVYAWNAHRDGKRVNTIRYDVKKNFSSIRD